MKEKKWIKRAGVEISGRYLWANPQHWKKKVPARSDSPLTLLARYHTFSFLIGQCCSWKGLHSGPHRTLLKATGVSSGPEGGRFAGSKCPMTWSCNCCLFLNRCWTQSLSSVHMQGRKGASRGVQRGYHRTNARFQPGSVLWDLQINDFPMLLSYFWSKPQCPISSSVHHCKKISELFYI